MNECDPTLSIYCPQLGMVINFTYCVSVNDGLPCRNTIGCWQERFDIAGHLKSRFTEDELKQVFGGPPRSRIERIAEAIHTAGKEKK